MFIFALIQYIFSVVFIKIQAEIDCSLEFDRHLPVLISDTMTQSLFLHEN